LAGKVASRSLCGIAAITTVWIGCAVLTPEPRSLKIDNVSRSSEAFFAFLESRGKLIAEIREAIPSAKMDSVFLIDEMVTNEELGDYVQIEASAYPFEIFLRITVSTTNQRVYRYIVKGDWRNVKMGYGSLEHPELYDAIYLHTHPRERRIVPNSISDYMHAASFRNVTTLIVGDGIPIEFESIDSSKDGVDRFNVDGREFSYERPAQVSVRSPQQRRHGVRDADADVLELDRIFRENVEAGHERVTLRNSDGMLVTYDRDQTVRSRLNQVYRDAGLPLPTGVDDITAPGDISQTPPAGAPQPVGF